MAEPRAFVSFDFDHDGNSRILFCGQAAKDSPSPFVIQDWSSKESFPESQWEAEVRDKISRTNMVVVLVGRFMGSASGVAREIAMAGDLNVPTFGVYVDGATTSSTLPAGLARNRVISWTWPGIAAAIEQMLGEGKNK